MLINFMELGPVQQAFLAGLFTWSVTAFGVALVFIFRDFSRKIMDAMLGFAGGVMLAAAVWSLLVPAIHLSE
jgi:zinc transporter, ZIP family